MPVRALIIAIVLVLILSPSTTLGQGTSSSTSAIQAWIDRAWDEAADNLPVVKGVSIRWRTEDRFIHSAAELAEMRREIENRPDHPKRMLVEQSERRIASGPDIMRYEIWLHGANAWRMNTQYVDGNYLDATWAAQRAWTLSPRGLTISEADAKAPSANPILSTRSSFSTDIELLLTGGFGFQSAWGSDKSPATVRGNDWEFTVNSPSPSIDIPQFLARFRGTWDDTLDRGFTRDIEVESSPTRQDSRWEFLDWQWSDALQRYIPNTVRFVAPGFDRLIVFEGTRPEPPGGFNALTQIPEPGGTDPIRGNIHPMSVRDHRTGIAKTRDRSGEWVEAQIAGPPSRRESGGSFWRIAGVALLSTILTGLLLWKWRGVSRNRSHS